jgi:hypothetical protein
MFKRKVNVKQLLAEIRNIIALEYFYYMKWYLYTEDVERWDGNVTYSGIQQLIYGIWHNGLNKEGINLLVYMPVPAVKEYRKLIAKYKHYKEI